MSTTLIDLAVRTRRAIVLRSIGGVLTFLFLLGCLASVLYGPEQAGVRIAAGVAVAVVVLGLVVGWRSRGRRVRWLGVDHEGMRLLNHRGEVLGRFAWGDLAGVGLMTNEAARRRHQAAASLTANPVRRALISMPIWLELFPASADAVDRQPRLRPAWELGRRQCWRIALGDGLGQSFPVEEHVRRRRPDLWRGHREGSALFG